jgi:adenine-specific DNA-methyltransferase
LWIELLKNAYYTKASFDSAQPALETLPNIDINIKCGNSLVSRFAIDADLSTALKKSKWTIDSYRSAVATYRNAESKEQKREMERLIADIKSDFRSEISLNDPKLVRKRKIDGELFMLTNQQQLFELERKEKAAWNKKVDSLTAESKKLENEIEEIKANKIFENAFEWRFEFPEVLDNDGKFVGFDVVIGNPPYIRQEEFSELKPYLKSRYKIYNSISDLLTYFVELGFDVLKSNGNFKFIISNKFTRANYGQTMRKFLLDNTRLTHFLDFSGIPVFDEATVDAAILGFDKSYSLKSSLIHANIPKENIDIHDFQNSLNAIKSSILQDTLNENVWAFENQEVIRIKHKIEAQGIQLKDWSITINYGIKTGLNDAFVIDTDSKNKLINDDPKSAEIIKPLLRGRDIQKWQADYQNLWLIATFPSKKYNIEDYHAVKNHLLSFGERLEQNGAKGSRKKTTNKWFETQDNIAYWQDFEKPKIIYPNMTKFLPFVLDFDNHFYHNDKSFHLVAERIYWLGAFLNSRLFKYCFQDNFPELLGGTRELRKVFFDKIPIKQISSEEEIPFKNLVDKILTAKKQSPMADTSALESEIDRLVYELYGLSEEEIRIVEGGVS